MTDRAYHAVLRWGSHLAVGIVVAVLPGMPLARAHGAGGTDRPLFREVADTVGLAFDHASGAAGRFYLPEIMGSGAALLDYDSDGDLDVYLVQGSPDARTSSRLFRNHLVEDGRLRFTDVTERARVGHRGWGMGVAVGDVDADADPDLYVTSFGPDILYRNNGDGTFTDVTQAAGVSDERWNASAAFVDYDADGDLDLFVTAYVDFTVKGNKPCYDATGARDYCLPAEYRPLPDRLFRNDGQGRFTDVTVASGVGSVAGAGLGVTAADFNGDGRVDLYVANDGTPNHLWINRGNGTFEETGLMSGSALDAAGRAKAGMGVGAGDFDNDGDEDLFVTNLVGEMNTLFLNDGTAAFDDVTNRFRLASVSLPFTGFGTDWFDYDNDGRLDLFIANGAVAIVDALRGKPYPYQQKNLLLHNESAAGFTNVSGQAGAALALSEVSRGAAFGDLDNDGDVDIVVTNNNGKARVLLNEGTASAHWLTVRLQGGKGNRDGLGAVVRIIRDAGPPLMRRSHTDSSYLSANDPRVHFGLGIDHAVTEITVDWPAGGRESWKSQGVDRVITLREGSGQPVARSKG
jgi:hypothetical protein